MENPKSLKEWILYVAQIPENELIVQAKYAGTSVFINMLKQDGYSLDDISNIHKAFALRFKQDGRRIPQYNDIMVNYNLFLKSNLP